MAEQGRVVADPPRYDKNAPFPSIELAYNNKLPNCPGKSCIGLLVTFPPGARTPPHRHAGAAVSVVVLKGTLLNKMNDAPTRVFSKGGSFFEAPGCHHKVSDNFSDTEEAQLIASMVIDTEVFEKGGVEALVEIDEEFR